MKMRLAFSLIILLLQWALANAAYAQESIPETVKRHERELQDMSEQIRLLTERLDEKLKSTGPLDRTEDSPSGQGFSVYVSPPIPKPQSAANRCSIFDMTIQVGTVEYEFTKIILVDIPFGAKTPYYISGTITCSDWIGKLSCAGSGTILGEPNSIYGFQITRPNPNSCSVEPLF